MSDTEITTALDRLDARYRVRFSGHSRVSRDPEELEGLLEELEALAPRAPEALSERVAQARKLYRDEIEAIKAARAVPFAVNAARLRLWAELATSRYTRGFAGQDRRTRDVALLDQIREDLRRLRDEMAALHPRAPGLQLDTAALGLDRALDLYLREGDAIRAARRTGTPAEQGSRLAEAANHQFALYESHFGGQPRISRHPPLLERLIAALEEIRKGMQALQAGGFDDPNNRRNIGIVTERVDRYRKELEAIRAQRRGASAAERATALGQAANAIFEEYRKEFAGQDRRTRNPELLDRLFEKLWAVAREMDALDRDDGDDTNARNLSLVTDNLRLYAREFDAIRTAKAQA